MRALRFDSSWGPRILSTFHARDKKTSWLSVVIVVIFFGSDNARCSVPFLLL